ncbi:MAG: CvpA family protein [Clostridia bacterium]|nr:CvpA family protein [Clostridia bacterium]
MNLTFFDRPLVWDILFLAILLIWIAAAAKKGAFRAVSGIAGTVLGVIVAWIFQSGLAELIEPLLRPVLQGLAQRADLSAVRGLEQGSALSDLVFQSSSVTDKLGELYQSLMARLAQQLSLRLAPIIAFLLLFLLVKLAIRILCAVLDWDIPVLSTLNRFAGGLLGALSGALIVLALCWAVMRFAPADNVGFLSRPCLQRSVIGGLVSRLFAALQ